MGKEPLKENTNVYFQARKRAAMSNDRLFSRENAAELLGISPYTLADYELGNTKVVPVDKVVLMADLYNAPELITGYCKYQCPMEKKQARRTIHSMNRLFDRLFIENWQREEVPLYG